ncbi:DUF4214 domain-containing protein [Pseudomonas sp. NPDC090202]|uniref:DUF4214 domain-containing protein n=1 Tax=unclassified Pseudomonas TaxID=196821 RepID=UPI00381100DC
MAITTAQIQQLYVAYLGRAADKAGLDYWANQLNTVPATLTLENLRANFVNEQPEYQNAYAGLTRAETVSKIYLQLFGRPADTDGLAYWTTGGGANVNADQLLVAFLAGASATDAKTIANKVLVAEVYTSTAGDNYAKADATSIISEVKDDTTSVTDALAHLEDGSLSGIAIPAGLAAVKAAAVAQAAVIADQATKVTSLTATNDKVVALNADYKVTLQALDANNDKTVSYDEATAALDNAKALFAAISGGSTIETLQTNAKTAADALKAKYDALVNTHVNAVAEVKAYNDAFAANAAVKAPADADIKIALDSLDSTFTNKPADLAAANTAYKAAVSGATDITTADQLFAAIKAADATTLSSIDKAFGTLANYSSVKDLAVADAKKDAAELALSKAIAVVGADYDAASVANTGATKILADAQKADALVDEAQAQVDAHQGIVDSAQDAVDAVPAFAHDLDAAAPVLVGDNAKADLFYFSDIKASDDFALTNFTKGDALYVGTGLTFNSNVTVDADGYAVGTNTAAKEIYFTKNATTGYVEVNVETNAVGHTAGTGVTDNVAVITLTGITDVSQVSYANGVITTTHAA